MITLLIWLGCAGFGMGLAALGWTSWRHLRGEAGDVRRRVSAGAAHVGAAIAAFPTFLVFGLHHPVTVALLLFYGWFVFSAWAVLAVALLVTSEPVTRRARTVAQAVPRLGSLGHWRTTAGLPHDWEGLVARNRELTTRLLDYFDMTDRRVAHPVMADVTDPYTSAALDAMFACDRLRDAGPPAWKPARQSEYAVAVAHFAQALEEAEIHSTSINRDRVSPAEQATTQRVLKSLTYLNENATTPAERQAAYEVLAAELAELRADESATTDGSRRGRAPASDNPLDLGPTPQSAAGSAAAKADVHPWLDVIQRALRG